MSREKPSQTQSVTGSQISSSQVQLGQADGNLNQVQQGNQATDSEQAMTAVEAWEVLEKIGEVLKGSGLPETKQEEAIAYLNAAQKETQQPEPDKELVAKNLKRMGETLKAAGDTVDAGKSLWEKVQPILLTLIGWLGTAKSFLGL
jgi:hypothetical protein